jgi:hypothetical protein
VKHQGLGCDGLILAPLAIGRGSHLLSPSLSGGEVHYQDPLYLVCGLTPRWCLRLNRGSGLLVGELASPWCCSLLGGGLPSAGLHLLPPVTSVTSLKREAGFWPRRHRPWGNHRRGLSGQSILHPWCGCDGSEQSPHTTLSGRGEAEAPVPTWHREDLLDGVLYHGLPWGRCPATSWAPGSGTCVTPPRGEAQAAEVVGDELKVPKVNYFAKGESTTRQTFTVGMDGDRR